jgi:hypothetical protein
VLDLPVELPEWIAAPAVTGINARNPDLRRAFRHLNDDKLFADQIKPFNFLFSTQTARLQHPDGVAPERFHLVGPHGRNPAEWLDADWQDLHGSDSWRITTDGVTDTTRRVIRVRAIGDVLAEYRRHPETEEPRPGRQHLRCPQHGPS